MEPADFGSVLPHSSSLQMLVSQFHEQPAIVDHEIKALLISTLSLCIVSNIGLIILNGVLSILISGTTLRLLTGYFPAVKCKLLLD